MVHVPRAYDPSIKQETAGGGVQGNGESGGQRTQRTNSLTMIKFFMDITAEESFEGG